MSSRIWAPRRRDVLATSAAALAVASAGAVPLLRSQASMPSLDGAVAWLNSEPLAAAKLRGKVVLVDFWTYTCINWQRTFPHVRAWAEKYAGKGLVVIGVHSPEFSFEKDLDRVRQATARLGVNYPVAVDSEHAVWRAFSNTAWPALYLVDAQGAIRHRHLGEGEYERSERVLQQLLAEAGAKDVSTELVRAEGQGSLAEADWANLRSPETYTGHARADSFASPGGFARDRARAYVEPERLRLNSWALAGNWNVGAEAATLEHGGGRVAHRFHARDLHLVMGSANGGRPVPFRVLLDGKPPGAAHGADIDAEGRGVLAEHRLYQLVRQPRPVQERRFEIQFQQPGAQAFAFTFG
jgi:thiol-disulfide isomerase/thioredoxin